MLRVMKVRALAIGVLVCLLGLGTAANASATPIGRFVFEIVDPAFIGPQFSFENSSNAGEFAGEFSDIILHLYVEGDPASGTDLHFADFGILTVDAGSAFDTSFLALSDFAPFNAASLELKFSQPGSVFVAPITGIFFNQDLDTGEFTGPTIEQVIDFTPVPEPGTLILTAGGLAAFAFKRRRRSSSPE